LQQVTTIRQMQKKSRDWHKKGLSIGFVPTMGYLHEGHMSLMKKARKDCDRLIVSIFVNPLQFGPTEDFTRYPRDIKRDRALCSKAGVDVLFIPSEKEMYPAGFQTGVEVEKAAKGLEGAARPGHFRGVATVVAKLFGACQPDVAFFGQKDYQQAVVIRQMVQDLSFPLKIVVCPTVRESSGLAASSRNSYLSDAERKEADILYRALQLGAKKLASGAPVEEALAEVRGLIASRSGFEVEYVEASDPRTLEPVREPGRPVVLLLAARLGKVRLIDNILVGARLNM
jgi:pantoate--beta-alanine ligase